MNNNVNVKIWRISGSFKQRQNSTPFSKELCALTEEHAKEKLFSELGSRNRLKQRQIHISSINEISINEITDPLVKQLVSTDFKIPFEE